MLMKLRDERGVALVVAMLMTMVVMILSATVVAQSISNSEESAYNRKRTLSVHSAEAGINEWFAYLEQTEPASISCNAKVATLDTEPQDTTFSAAATFYAANGSTVMNCPFTNSSYPSYARIVSTATVNGEVSRQIETYLRLSPITAGASGSAIMSNSTANFVNSFDVYGLNGIDGDIYVLQGNAVIGNSAEVRGSVYVANGTASLENSARIYGDLWASGSVTIGNSSRVDRDAKSNSGPLNGINSSSVGRDAYSGTTISNLTVSGTKYQNANLGPVPTKTFPTFVYNAADWTGYTITTYTGANACTNARNFLTGSWSGKRVVRITGATPCTLQFPNSNVINMNADLAVITDWGIEMVNSTEWKGNSGPVKKLMLLVTHGASCPTGASNKNIIENNSTKYDEYVNVVHYTPCTFTAANSTGFDGQVYAQTVNIQNSFAMSYAPIEVPGLSTGVSGFDQDISYIRET